MCRLRRYTSGQLACRNPHRANRQRPATLPGCCALGVKAIRRPILIEHARRRNLKRGGGVRHVSLENAAALGGKRSADLVALDDAMKALAQLDPRKERVVEMRFFGGLSVEETAEVLKISPVTVMRDWSTAKAWLYRELGGKKV